MDVGLHCCHRERQRLGNLSVVESLRYEPVDIKFSFRQPAFPIRPTFRRWLRSQLADELGGGGWGDHDATGGHHPNGGGQHPGSLLLVEHCAGPRAQRTHQRAGDRRDVEQQDRQELAGEPAQLAGNLDAVEHSWIVADYHHRRTPLADGVD